MTTGRSPAAAVVAQRPPVRRRIAAVVLVALCAAAADGVSKVWARQELAAGPVPLGPLELRLGFNSGVAFGIGAGAPGWLVLTVTGVIVTVLLFAALRLRPSPAAGLVVGGGMANFADRAADGTVTDFLSVGWWPTFNLADTFLVIGLLWIAAHAWRADARRAGTDPTEEQA